MAILTANGSGEISGHFTIPAGVIGGIKRVVFTGQGGTVGEASYEGFPVTRNISKVRQTISYVRRVDPLAQTFMLSATTMLSGIDLFFTAKGTSPVIVQIRKTSNGIPNQEIVAQAVLEPASINVNGTHTRFLFEFPVLVQENEELAIVAMCNDAVSSLNIASLGAFDSINQKWVTSQAYQIGTLLSSSNASTWTAHQESDLTFRLLSPIFSETTKTVNLGTTSVTAITDLMVLADVYLPSASTYCDFTLTLVNDSGRTIKCAPYQQVKLDTAYTGSVQLTANLVGTSSMAPILFGSPKVITGVIETSGTYITRLFEANSATEIVAIMDAYAPGSSTIAIHARTSADTVWTAIPLISSKAIADGFAEITYKLTGFSDVNTRIKITMTGNAANRPKVRNLRVAMI